MRRKFCLIALCLMMAVVFIPVLSGCGENNNAD